MSRAPNAQLLRETRKRATGFHENPGERLSSGPPPPIDGRTPTAAPDSHGGAGSLVGAFHGAGPTSAGLPGSDPNITSAGVYLS